MDLPFHTLTQFVALGLTLIAGWFLGLASASGGRKWRERYYDEEVSNASYRDQAQTDLRESARRVRDLEAENAKLRAGAPAPAAEPAHDEGHSTAALAGAAVAGAAVGAAVTHAVEEHHAEPAVAEHHPEPVAEHHAEPAAADHAEPAGPAVAAHDDHAHPEPALAHGNAADAHPAPTDAHHH